MKVQQVTSQQTQKKAQPLRVSAGVRRISSSAMLSEAGARMRQQGLDSLSVVENRKIVGRITEQDVARAIAAGMNPATTPVKQAMRVEE